MVVSSCKWRFLPETRLHNPTCRSRSRSEPERTRYNKMKKVRGFGEVNRYVAGIDLAGAADHYVCGPRKDDDTYDIEHFGTTTPELERMLVWLRERGVVSVAMESTSVYWIPVYDMLEKGGIKPVLVDTRQVHMVPGKKSDVKDCQWLQRLHSCGLLRGAFRPPEEFNAIRTIIREKANIEAMRVQAIQAIQKAMDQMNIRLHHAVRDITGVTGMKILAAIVGGERDPRNLAKLRDHRCKKSAAEIAEELTGNWRDEHLFTLKQAYETLVFLDGKIAEFNVKIRAMYAKLAAESKNPDPPPPEGRGKAKDKVDVSAKRDLSKLLNGFDPTTIDGVGYDLAAEIVAETGTDLSMFENEAHFISYIGLKPSLAKSAGKNVRTGKKVKNTCRIGQCFRQAAVTLTKSDNEMGARYRCVKSRTSPTTAIKDVARELAKRYYRGVRWGQKYVDIGKEAYLRRKREWTLRMVKRNILKMNISAEVVHLAIDRE